MTTATAEQPADAPTPSARMPARRHSRWSAAVFAVKRKMLQARRGAADKQDGIRAAAITPEANGFPFLLAEHVSPLWTETAATEQKLQFGKVQNLRVAVRRLNGATLLAHGLFSFWNQIGPPTARRGFVPGRELREGCLIPAIGGGICQLSNALYAAAIAANAEIVERHAHSQVVPNSAAAAGRDATVAYNYIDLRFRVRAPLRIEARLTHDALTIRLWGSEAANQAVSAPERVSQSRRRVDLLLPTPNSCVSCGQEPCFRHAPEPGVNAKDGRKRAAILVSGLTPETKVYLTDYDSPGDRLFLPFDGRQIGRRTKPSATPMSLLHVAPLLIVRQGVVSRLLRWARRDQSPAARRERHRRNVASLAEAYARRLRPDETHLIVEQQLLPSLWANGILGGRTFDVLMSQMPLRDLQSRLDEAARRWPESGTLGDFRAPESDVRAEADALDAARHIVTAHPELAARYGDRAKPIFPPPLSRNLRERAETSSGESRTFVAFVGPTLGRKGCYELRAALRELQLPVMLIGRNLEDRKFWDGIPRINGATEAEALAKAAVVVQPSLWEARPPAPLLHALEAGIPVVATPGCGLGNRAGVVTIPFGDAAALTDALRKYAKTTPEA